MKKRYKIPIAKKGEWPNGDVIQVIDDASLDAIVKNTMASLGKTGKVLADFDHYSELSNDVKKALSAMGVQLPTNAGGWISNVYRDGDTVWGDMQSTPEGEEAIESQSYCKTSPVFRLIDCSFLGNRGAKKLLRPLKLKSIALTNLPAMASLGSVMQNREMIMNAEDDLQSVFLGSAMDMDLEKGKEHMSESKEVLANAEPVKAVEAPVEPVKEDAKPVETPTVEEVKEAVIEDIGAEVGIVAESQGLTTEQAQVVVDTAQAVATDAVEAVETAVTEAQPVEAPKAEDAPNAEVEALKAKIAELQSVIDEAKTKEAEQALQNRINEELAKYPTLQNKEEAGELLKNNWDLGTRFLSSLKFSVVSAPSKTIQNRIPAKSPEADLSAMSKHERLRYKMFGK